ncbi:ABC transporter permease [Curtobacterium sp. MCBA15_001]|uniref:ABC transporter permease n=1 Tax=Curtobacterium sp. MCBA15_001 TaxID=1898731 RepID=UPI0008DDD4BB|nr:ABC transporter permease [Curtobacterium sp. MCBA15_001]OIH94297.1 ABC transporter permease [Curtobacterium sp. MCBA15_001]
MIGFVLRRVASGIALVVVIATVTFFLLRAGGTNVARTLLGETATQDQIAAKLHELGLDRNVLVQYGDWLSHAVRGDFGTSWLTNQPVTTALVDRLPVTLSIAIGAVVLTAVVSVLLGVLAAYRRGWIDRVVQVLGIAGFAMPGVWLALILILAFAIKLAWFPATGYVQASQSLSGWAIALVLPVVAIAVSSVASTAQQVRSAMLEVLQNDYVRTLRSRGLSERSVVLRHALRNAAPTGLTVISLEFISLLGSTVVIERIFALPGIGSMVLDATVGGDSPQVLGVVVMMVIVVVLVNLVIDLLNGWLNPKVRVR